MNLDVNPLATLFSPEEAEKIHSGKVLLVGAGGIGCELLKDLIVAGIRNVHVVDLDTIDLSNLNRQFLFGPQHINKPKATIACEVVADFTPSVSNITPYMADITSSSFNAKWFKSFDLVFNALDNAAARRHVNKMCVATDIPLIDVGSEGFNGQSQVILPQQTECYDCFAHPTPKTFPVCTIRSTPTQPIHCIVWAKSFLLPTLFGEEAPESEDNNENETIEQRELVELKALVSQPGFIKKVAEKVFVKDIQRLAGMTTMWEDRSPPTPLDIPADFDPSDVNAGEQVIAEDQQVWSIKENLQALVASAEAMVKRQKAGEGLISFDKDDDDTLDFVCAAANLRATCFSIQPQTKWETKSIAGNIIPAAATTNAIVGGLAAIEALKLLAGRPSTNFRSVYIARSENKVLVSDKLQPRKQSCVICGVARTSITAPVDEFTLGDLVDKLKQKFGYEDVSLLTDRLIYDPDFDDNLESSLSSLGLADNFVTVVDDDERRVNLEVYIENKQGDAQLKEVNIPLRPELNKRPRSDSDDDEDDKAITPPAKKEAPAANDLFADDVIELD